MADLNTGKNGADRLKKARQWAEKQLIILDEAREYDKDLSALTGSGYQGDFGKLWRLDHYSQARLLEMMFQETEKRRDINGLLGVEDYFGLLFAGPDGCGKMTTAEHLVGNLKKRGYTRLVMLTGSRFGSGSPKKAVKRMQAVLSLAKEEQPMILILEQLSENRYAKELYEILLDFARDQETENFFPILIERDANVFSSALKRSFPLILFDLPSLEERKNYIRLHQNAEVLFDAEDGDETDGETEILKYRIVFDGITPDEIAAETEGFSYGQLKALIEYMKLYLADIIVRDQAAGSCADGREAADDPASEREALNNYAYERLQDEGYYTVKGHMARQGIRMLSHVKENPFPMAVPGAPLMGRTVAGQPMPGQSAPASPQQEPEKQPGADIRRPLSEIEQKVKLAAEGGPKDYRALTERYRNPVYKMDEFGEMDERLASASDEYDAEE